MWTQRILFSLQVCVNEAASFDDGGCWKSWKRFAGMNSHRTKFGASIINRKVCKLVLVCLTYVVSGGIAPNQAFLPKTSEKWESSTVRGFINARMSDS